MNTKASDTEFKVSNEKERLLCYASGILCALLANPNNTYTSKNLIPSSIDAAEELVKQVYAK